MAAPVMRLQARQVVVLEERGIIYQTGRCSQAAFALPDQVRYLIRATKVAAHGQRFRAGRRNLLCQRVGLGLRMVIVKREIPAVGGEPERNRPTHALAGAGNQGHASLVFRPIHVLLKLRQTMQLLLNEDCSPTISHSRLANCPASTRSAGTVRGSSPPQRSTDPVHTQGN